VLRYRLFEDGLAAGRSRSDERVLEDGVEIAFSAELGAPRPSVALVGTVSLGPDLAWRSLVLAAGGPELRLALDPQVELEVEGVPALLGVTVRRLQAAGLAPAEQREVQVLRVGRELTTSRLRVRYLWVGGQIWRYRSRAEGGWLAVRPQDGVVRSIDQVAELEE
jgi:hypothetical protein